MLKQTILLTTCCVFLTTAAVAAAPSINGSTGLINTPSADVLHEGQFSLGYYRFHEAKIGSVVANVGPNLELGLVFADYNRQSNRHYLNAKFGIVSESVTIPGLAVGIEDVAGRDDRSYYAVASKGLPFGFRLHAGVGNGRYDGFFAAVEKIFQPIPGGGAVFPTTSLIAEYDGRHVNFGVRMATLPGIKLDAGWRDDRTYVGASINF